MDANDDFKEFLKRNGVENIPPDLKDLRRWRKNFFKGFLQRYDEKEADIFRMIWKTAKVDFFDFMKHPQDYRNALHIEGLIWDDDLIPVGKKVLEFALIKANEYGHGIDFFFQDNEIDYPKLVRFCYEVFIIDLIEFHEDLLQQGRANRN